MIAIGRTARTSRRTFAGWVAATAWSPTLLPGRARAAEFEYKIASNQPVEQAMNVRVIQMCDAIRRETSNRVAIKLFPNGILGSETAMLTQLRVGAIQFLMSSAGLENIIPLCNIQGIPFAFKSYREVFAAHDGALGEMVRREIAAKGMFALPKIWDIGFREVSNDTRPIRVADDLAGLKIRVPLAKVYVDTFKALGASPTPLTLSETYTALQTHLVNGAENSYQSLEQQRFYEVQKYLSGTNQMWAGAWLVGNADAWRALPPDIQQVFLRNAAKYTDLQRRDSQLLNAAFVEKLQRQGMRYNVADPTTFKARMSPVYKEWRADFGPTAWAALEQYSGKLT